MAEFLIKAIDYTHIDPVKDKAGCYKKGDIVQVMPNGHQWGNKECLPLFYVFKIPNLSLENAQKYIVSEWKNEDTPEMEVVTRRKFKFDIDVRVSQQDRDAIAQSPWLVLGINEAHLEDKTA